VRRRPRPTLFPYTTLFRSLEREALDAARPRLREVHAIAGEQQRGRAGVGQELVLGRVEGRLGVDDPALAIQQHLQGLGALDPIGDRKSTRLNSSHVKISYA